MAARAARARPVAFLDEFRPAPAARGDGSGPASERSAGTTGATRAGSRPRRRARVLFVAGRADSSARSIAAPAVTHRRRPPGVARTGSRSRASSAAASRRRASRWSAGWRSGSTRPAHRGALDGRGGTGGGARLRARRALSPPNRALHERICERGRGVVRAAARPPPVPLELPGAQPDHGRAGRRAIVVEGARPVGLADHQPTSRSSSAGPWERCPGGSRPRSRRAPTRCCRTAPPSSPRAEDVLDELFGADAGDAWRERAARAGRR